MRVLVYGDSNSFGTAPMASLTSTDVVARRWPDIMAAALTGVDIVVEALPGRTTVLDDPAEGEWRNGLRVLPAILHSHAPIDLLILALGTNDLKHRFGSNASDVGQGIGALVREARRSEVVARTLAVCPPPVLERGVLAEVFEGAEARCAGLFEAVSRFADPEGASVLNAGRHIASDDLDGVHWSQETHDRFGGVMANHVEAHTE